MNETTVPPRKTGRPRSESPLSPAERARRSREARAAAGGEHINVIVQGAAADRLRELLAAGEDRRAIVERALLAL